MRHCGKKLWLVAVLMALFVAALFWIISGGPYYHGRPVSQWAVHYSGRLYPSGTAPLSPSQEGLRALRNMGPRKAAIALIGALLQDDSRLYEQYRQIHPKFPAWYRNWFPLKLTHQQRVMLILGSTEFFDAEYQKAIVPFLVPYLEKPDAPHEIAACDLLAQMPEAAAPALPVLNRLTASAEPSVAQAAQAAVARIISVKRGSE